MNAAYVLLSRLAITASACCAAVIASPLQAGNPSSGSNTDTLYQLNSGAEYLEGCFDPCTCPISTSPISGTFVLGPVMIGDAFNFREVREVSFVVTKNNMQTTIHGSGGYYVSNFGPPVMHSMELDLSINGGPLTHFFSDLHPVTANDGSIDLAVSINGMYCLDTVIEVDASPVTSHATYFGLGNSSSYQQGCFDPCDCPLEQPRVLNGSFGLVPLVVSNQIRDFAVTRVRFTVGNDNNLPPLELNGFGRYTITYPQGQAMQRLTLTLDDDGDANTAPLQFDSGDVPINSPFPIIDITVDMNGQVCFDTVLDIRAAPRRSNASMSNANQSRSNAAINAP